MTNSNVITRTQLIHKLCATIECMDNAQLAAIHNEIFVQRITPAEKADLFEPSETE